MRFVRKSPRQSIEEWTRKLLGDIQLSDDDEFVEDMMVGEYFALNDEQRDELWRKWEHEADRATERMTARKVTLGAHIFR